MDRLLVRIKYVFCNDFPFRDMSFWRRAWYYTWEWVHMTLWRKVLMPHLIPRRWYESRRDFWKHVSLPRLVLAYIWQPDDVDYYLGECIEQGPGRWDLCCFHGETQADVRKKIRETLELFAEEAGVRFPSKGYEIFWVYAEPTDAERKSHNKLEGVKR